MMSGAGPGRAYDSPSAQSVASSVLPRVQWFEFNELDWLPETVRNAITETLRVLSLSLRVHEVIWPVLQPLIDQTGSHCIVDLCSGAGGPVVALANRLSQADMAALLESTRTASGDITSAPCARVGCGKRDPTVASDPTNATL